MKLPLIVVRKKAPKAMTPQDYVLISTKGKVEPPPLELEVKLTDATVEEKLALNEDEEVVGAAPSMPVHLIKRISSSAAGGALKEGVSWGIKAVNADKCELKGDGVTVAVLDTGIDRKHPAFAAMGKKISFKNFTEETDDDVDGHGTHCAGTIFGQDVEGHRIGIASGIKRALIGKVITKQGGSTENIVHAIQWALSEGAQVISMSLGMDFAGYQKYLVEKYKLPPEQATSMALAGYRDNVRLFDRISAATCSKAAIVNSAVVLAAAGNESDRPKYSITVAPPAAAEFFQPIAAIGPPKDGNIASCEIAAFSNDGATFAAPGVDIWSAEAGKKGLVSMSGTSMATPHVAGVAALWIERALATKSFSAPNVVDSMVGACIKLPNISRGDVLHGLVQAPP